VVKIEDAEKAVQSEAFDPVAYVDGIWESKLLPAFNEKAVELSKFSLKWRWMQTERFQG
jgi:predicted lipoprotein